MERAKRIYVIIEGEYSDWKIIGYTDSENDAMQICAQHNQDDERYEDWYYEATEKADSPKQKIRLQYFHNIVFDGNKNICEELCKLEYIASDESQIEKVEIEDSPVSAYITISVPLKENNPEKAKKIAQDALYQYLYEKHNK